MNREMISQAKADEEILTLDVSDDLLERAGSVEQNAEICAFENSTMVALVAGGGGICGRFDSFSCFLSSTSSGSSAQITVIFFLFESITNVGLPR